MAAFAAKERLPRAGVSCEVSLRALLASSYATQHQPGGEGRMNLFACRKRIAAAVGAVALSAGSAVLLIRGGAAQAQQSFSGNVTTCEQLGFGGSTQTTGDENVGATVSADGEFLDVTLLNGSVVIDAIVVKGGPGYNVYTSAGSGLHAPDVGNGNTP